MSRNLQHLMVAVLLLLCAGSAAAGLVGHWTLDETSGTVASDSGPNKINGTVNGNPKWVPGKIGGALEFDGDGDFVDCGNAAPLNIRDETTLACWIKIASFTRNWEAIIAKGDNSYRMSRSATTGNSIHFGLNGPTGGNLNANKIVTDNEWHHVALVYDGANKIIYIDGVEDARVASTGQIGVSTYNLHIGDNSQQANRGLKGIVDDVRLYDRGASAEQIKELAANGTHPTWPKAWQPNPTNGAVGVNSPLFQWTKGENAIFHNVYLGTTPELTEANLGAKLQPFAMYFHQQPLVPGTTYYWRVDEVEVDMTTTHTGDVWSFTATPLSAWQPAPADKAGGVPFVPTLRWNPGQQATKHRVYLSASFADVNTAAAAAGQGDLTNTSLAAPLLRASTTYFWRVDEVKADGTAERGAVWSFTTADAIAKKIVRQWWTGITGTAVTNLTGNANYPNNPTGTALLDTFEGPVSFADNYGTRLYGWLTPPQSGDYTFWIASDDSSELQLSTDVNPANTKVIASVSGWTSAKQWDKFPTQKSAAITLQAGQKYYIQALQKDGTGGDNIAVSWQGPGIATQTIISAAYVDAFALPPLQAFAPSPANGGVDAPQAGALSWSAGEKAQKHDVYFGENQAAVAAADTTSPLYKGQQAGTTLDTGDLEWGKIYYWRVDEINTGAADSPWKGTVWSFTTATFIQVDNFESYTDDEGSRIYETWVDGWTNGTGSIAGNTTAPFAERTIIHTGKQALPMDYNNTKTPFYSEVEQTFSPLQNWMVNDVNALSLWFRGRPVPFIDKGNEAFTVGASGHDIWDNADDFRFIYKKLSGNGSIMVKAENLVNTNAWAKAGVMIRDSLDAGSAMAYMIQSYSSGVSFGWRLVSGATCSSATQAGIGAPQWVKLTRTGNAFTAQYSADGKTWKDIADAAGKPVSTAINMGANIYIGLCVTSHNTGATTTAEFSGAVTTGGVTGAWQSAWIGDDPDRTNSVAGLYVAVEDSAGKVAVVTHSDPAAVNASAWTQWKIPLNSLTGVNLAKVKKLYIGVGDRKNPVADGAGRIYIDDIRVTRP